MAQQFNEHDLHLLDYESVELKHDKPDELSVYDAVAKAGADRVTHRFIYLKSRCSRKGALQAVSYLSETPVPAKTYVVKASSLHNQKALDIVKRAGCRLQSHEDLIWEQLGDVFGPFLTSLSETMALAPSFMQPRLKDHPEQRHNNEALPLIMRYMRSVSPGDNVQIRVLSLSIPSFNYQMTPKISLNTRCSISICENFSINGCTRSSGQLGIWSYSINP